MESLIKNPQLNIDENDIKESTDLTQLRNWRYELKKQKIRADDKIMRLKALYKTGHYTDDEYRRTKSFIQITNLTIEMVDDRIECLKN